MNSSTIDQYYISKGGVAALYGSAYNGLIWSNMLADYIIDRFVESSRYEKVILILADRSPLDFKKYFVGDTMDKVFFIDFSENMNSILASVLETKASLDPSIPIAIIVFSASEIILQSGELKAFQFFDRLRASIRKSVTELQVQSSSSTTCTTDSALLFVVHESLHVPSLLHRFQSFCNVNIMVKPNRGTLSGEVLCEVHSIRRSLETGRVKEDADMFVATNNLAQSKSKINSLLTPILRKKINDDPSEEPLSEGLKKDAVQEFNSLSEMNPAAVISNPKSANPIKQLVTFDSTDPEFDDDEDPDNDLDL